MGFKNIPAPAIPASAVAARTGWCQVPRCRQRIFTGVGLAPLWVCTRHYEMYQHGLARCQTLALEQLASPQEESIP